MSTQSTAPFVPPVGELLCDVDGNALMRVQPVITCLRSNHYWDIYIPIKLFHPEVPSTTGWVTEGIGFLETDGRKTRTPAYLLLTRSDLYGRCKFEDHSLPGEDKPVTLTLGKQTTQIVLDDRSSTIVRHLIMLCHDITMCSN